MQSISVVAPASACSSRALGSFQFLKETSTVFRAAHPFAVSEYVNEHVGNHDLSLNVSASGTAALAHRKFGSIDLCRLAYGSEARIVSERLHDIYHLQFILRGQCRYELEQASVSLSPGHLMLINPDDPVDLTYSHDCEKFILRLPMDLLNTTCAEHQWHQPQGGIRFRPVPYRFDALESLLSLLNLICQEAESDVFQPQLYNHYGRVIATKLMTMLDHNVSLEKPSLVDVSFERLVHYIEEHIKSDLCVEKLAAQARMSTRSVYHLFEKHAKTTPKHFIRQKKLQAVHKAMMDPNCQFANITALALEYGFTHLGRFAEIYRDTFGMLPSDAIKRRAAA